MKLSYKPKSNLEKFGQKVCFLLVENSYPTFYVGGVVRDLLLGREVKDIDIATAARPRQVAKILAQAGINADLGGMSFGVIKAFEGQHAAEVATFRKDSYRKSRYPKVSLVNTPKADSLRRDFSINSLYLSSNFEEVLDFHNGLRDIKNRLVRFIGKPEVRIKEDPLRIVRALRFALELNFSLEKRTGLAIEKNLELLSTLTKNKIELEIKKLHSKRSQNLLRKYLNETGNLTLHEQKFYN